MTSSAYFPTSTHLFEMKGPDARDFLHRLTTADVRHMEPGDFRPGFFLSAPGKVRTSFRVACRAPDSFYLEVEGGKNSHWRDQFLSVVDQVTFSENYSLNEVPGLLNAWALGLPFSTEQRMEERTLEGRSLILLHASKRALGTHWTSVWGNSADVEQFLLAEGALTITESEFERLRIHALFPRVDHEIGEDTNPLDIGMREAIADNKGCYPGQEVIEKIISLGSPAKRLALLSGTGPRPARGSALRTEEGAEVGLVTSATPEESDAFSVLALLRKNVATGGKILRVGEPGSGVAVTVERVADYE